MKTVHQIISGLTSDLTVEDMGELIAKTKQNSWKSNELFGITRGIPKVHNTKVTSAQEKHDLRKTSLPHTCLFILRRNGSSEHQRKQSLAKDLFFQT